MERVKKGEKYWYLYLWGASPRVTPDREGLNPSLDAERFAFGNYFHTEEEAESMVRKFRAVLKGADVIEMPSEEEIAAKADSIFYNYPHPYEDGEGYALLDGTMACDAMVQMANWLKSKIVK